MLIISTLSLVISSAVTLRRDMSILFNRVVITCLFYCLLQSFVLFSIISEGIGVHGGVFHITTITQIFHIFLYFITILILQLTGFFPRIFRDDSLVDLFSDDTSINETGEHLKIIEYPLILLFIITGAAFLMSTNDFVSVFLSIELQSYVLCILSTIVESTKVSETLLLPNISTLTEGGSISTLPPIKLPPAGSDVDAWIQWLEVLLSNGLITLAIFYSMLALIFAGLYVLIYDIIGKIEVDRPSPSLDLIPTTVSVRGLIYSAIADTNDPQGIILRQLYRGVDNVVFEKIFCHISGEEFWCVRSTIPLGRSLMGSYIGWPIFVNFFMDGDQYITILFPAFNPVIWYSLRSISGIRIFTGYDHNRVEILPTYFNQFTIPVRGLRSIYFETVRSIN